MPTLMKEHPLPTTKVLNLLTPDWPSQAKLVTKTQNGGPGLQAMIHQCFTVSIRCAWQLEQKRIAVLVA